MMQQLFSNDELVFCSLRGSLRLYKQQTGFVLTLSNSNFQNGYKLSINDLRELTKAFKLVVEDERALVFFQHCLVMDRLLRDSSPGSDTVSIVIGDNYEQEDDTGKVWMCYIEMFELQSFVRVMTSRFSNERLVNERY